MGSLRFGIYGLLFASALGLTVWIYAVNKDEHIFREKRLALEWARQAAAQAQGLSLVAREQGHSNPVGWAASQLNRGETHRRLKIFVLTIPQEVLDQKSTREFYEFDLEKLELDYAQVFSRVDRSGVRIQVRMNFPGFLGTQSRWMNDVLFIFSFLSILASQFGLIAIFPQIRRRFFPTEKTSPAEDLRVQAWIQETRLLMETLGLNAAEILKNARIILSESDQVKKKLLKLNHQSDLKNDRDLQSAIQSLTEIDQNRNEMSKAVRETIHTMSHSSKHMKSYDLPSKETA